MMKLKSLMLICAVSAALSSSAAENIIYYSLFDTVGWWQPSDAAKAWEISSELPGATRGKALKIIPKFGEGTDRRIMLLDQIPFIRARKSVCACGTAFLPMPEKFSCGSKLSMPTTKSTWSKCTATPKCSVIRSAKR